MTMTNPHHLPEEALNDVLIGLGSPESEAHLAACADCRGRVEGFQSTVQAFNATTMAWSEAQPTRPLARATRGKYMGAPLGWALAATAALVAIGVPIWNANHRAVENVAVAPIVVPAVSQEDSEAQIAQDNELLRSVNVALSSDDASPLAELGLSDRPHARAGARTELRNQ